MACANLNNKELIELQKKFRNKQIKEEEIPKEQLKELKELYYEQIQILEKSIESDKQKILKIRRNLLNRNKK